VALSRAMARSNIRILAVPATEKDMNKEKGKGRGRRKRQMIYSQRILYIRGSNSMKEIMYHASTHIFFRISMVL
jgi:hypothetical protein